jgi:predicted RNase H-like HicB family nuclease
MLPRVVMIVPAYRLAAAIWKEPEGYVAKCSEPGVASAGDSLSDVLASLKEATELYLENVELIHNSISISPFILDCLNNRGTESWNA